MVLAKTWRNRPSRKCESGHDSWNFEVWAAVNNYVCDSESNFAKMAFKHYVRMIYSDWSNWTTAFLPKCNSEIL